MFSMFALYEDQLTKERDEMLRKLEMKYMLYIHKLLIQKILISETIRKEYDNLIKSARNHMHMYSDATKSIRDTSPTTLPRSFSSKKNKNIPIHSQNNAPNSIFEFVPHMSLQNAEKININDQIDHRDVVGCYIQATVINKMGSNLQIHYKGWGKEWDVWSDYKKELDKFAKYKSISERPPHRLFHLKKGDMINVNPINTGWKEGKIIEINSGQIKVFYTVGNYNHFWWTHIDNKKEVQPLNKIISSRSLGEKHKFDCLYCINSYKNHKNLEKHVQRNHSEKTFMCSFCPFASSYGIGDHELQHTRDEYYKCNLCTKLFGCNTSFRNQGALTSHTNKIHKKERDITSTKPISGRKRKLFVL